MNAPVSRIDLAQARLEPVKHQQVVAGGSMGGANPSSTREFGERVDTRFHI
jgi:hypothetical protein